MRATKEILGWDPDEHFHVPDAVREHMADVAERGAELEREWERALRRVGRGASPSLRRSGTPTALGSRARAGSTRCPWFEAGEDIATRDAGKKVMNAIRAYAPTMVGGAADLVESTKTELEGGGIFSATHAGRNVAFGIREHAMGSIVNGIALDPAMLKPFGSTFLIFSDYMRPAVRLSALMGLETLWVWTHDSVGLGEDGPTHQPVEHHMALRAIPNLWYVRPGRRERDADGLADRPRAQGRPRGAGADAAEGADLRPRARSAPAEGALRGAYTLWQSGDGEPDVILLATGSEVHGRARRGRATMDANARVVSMPCWELFAEQPAGVPRRGAAAGGPGARLGRGRDRARLGALGRRPRRQRLDRALRRVGARASVLEKLGITADNVAARARRCSSAWPDEVAAAFDHRGVKLREAVLGAIEAAGHEVVDLGVDTDAEPVDYPDNARDARHGDPRRGEAERGVLVCGSGVGASVAASKIPGIRAAVCHDTYSAHQGVEHDDMNVLCLGSEVVGAALARGARPRVPRRDVRRRRALRRAPGEGGQELLRRSCHRG